MTCLTQWGNGGCRDGQGTEEGDLAVKQTVL